MSYDLTFHWRKSREEVEKVLGTIPFAKLNDGEVEYENSDTGVYFFGSFQTQADQTHCRFEVNLPRPCFFGYEAAAVFEYLAHHLGDKIEDPQMLEHILYDSEKFCDRYVSVAGWAYRSNRSVAEKVGGTLLHGSTLAPRMVLLKMWEWNFAASILMRNTPAEPFSKFFTNRWPKLAKRVDGKYFMPSLRCYQNESQQVGLACVWPDGIGELLPTVNTVILGRVLNDGSNAIRDLPWADLPDKVKKLEEYPDTWPHRFVNLEHDPAIQALVATANEAQTAIDFVPYDELADAEYEGESD